MLGNLTREERVPELHPLWADLPLCFGDDSCGGDGSGVGERLEDRAQAEEEIAVAVGDVDRGEVLPARLDPVHDSPGVLRSEEGIDQYRVLRAADQRDRAGRPGGLTF